MTNNEKLAKLLGIKVIDFENPDNFVKLFSAINKIGKHGTLVEIGDNSFRIQNFATSFTTHDHNCKYAATPQKLLIKALLDTSNFINCNIKNKNEFIKLLQKEVKNIEWS